uniref:polysaccharide biosynthesis/export family protein n=1 Tax=Prosthecobacter sp. TaxID=1965333 RepID=UPI0037847604
MLQVACSVLNDGGQGIPPPRIPKLASSASMGASEPLFRSGDFVELLVEEDVSFNGIFEVRVGGYVLIPKIGRVVVVGLNRDAVEKRIRESLQQQQLKQATVFVEHRPGPPRINTSLGSTSSEPSITIFLTGAVARPGQHRLPLQPEGGTPGVFETLLIAGGLAKFGDESKVRVMRLNENGTRSSIVVDVRKIRDGLSSDVPIGDGDIIQVSEKVFGF